jgi:tetratricopeptide (TPR) repeat protein
MMDEALREKIYNNLLQKETDDLLETWQNFDDEEYDPAVFDILKEILTERLGVTPPESPRTQIREILVRVDIYSEAGELEKALEECHRAIRLAPEYARTYNYRGVIYDELGQTANALADYQVACRLDPTLEDALENLAGAEKDIEKEFNQSPAKQKLDQALEDWYGDESGRALEECEAVRQTLPAIAKAWNDLGMTLDEMEQTQPAIDAYLRAVQLNPRFYPARENLANARVKLDAEEAHRAAEENWEDEPGEEEIPLDLGDIQNLDADGWEGVIPDWTYMDETAYFLSGWPGHRTRQGRCGLDPLDSDFELAHMSGVVARSLFTGRLLTHQPAYLILMICVGCMCCTPLFYGMIALVFDGQLYVSLIIGSCYYWVPGMLLLVNVFLSLIQRKPDASERNGSAFFEPGE